MPLGSLLSSQFQEMQSYRQASQPVGAFATRYQNGSGKGSVTRWLELTAMLGPVESCGVKVAVLV